MSKVLKLKSGATFRQENVSLKRDFISYRMINTDHMRSRNKKVGGQMKQKIEEVTTYGKNNFNYEARCKSEYGHE